jgi:phospho-N-acetylmuramoyl-pentapeptide-transferase
LDSINMISPQVKAFVFAFTATVIMGVICVPLLRRFKMRQTVRSDGPATHLKKTGTPTMGGIIFMVPILIIGLIFEKDYPGLMPVVVMTLLFGLVGFMDDFLKIIRRNNKGLKARQKMLGIIIIATVFTFYIILRLGLSSSVIIPFMGVDSGFRIPMILFIPLTVFVIIGTTNAVNLTDGLDGLAAGITLIVMVFFTITAVTRSEWDYIKIFSAICAGGCLGFLVFNMHPAKVIMGDTGALALGGAVSAAAIMMRMPWILIIVGAVYVIETLSDIIQVVSFKTRGKRVFKMAPIHHHFELSGWKETKVVWVFWIFTIVFCLAGFLFLRLRLFV